MCLSGLKLIVGGLLLSALLFFSFSAFGQDMVSAKEKAIQLNLNQEILLLQLEASMKLDTEEIERIKSELKDSRESSATMQQRSELEISALRKRLSDKEIEYQEKERLYNKLSSSIDKSERSRKQAQGERDFWRGFAVVVTLCAAGYIAGNNIGWW